MPLSIGPYKLRSRLLLAPMAGITDKPYREICRYFGAGLTSSEMISSDLSLLKTKKTQNRLLQLSEPEPRSVQIVGTDPEVMAEAAQFNEGIGANIIDINMGCPAKKVCSKAAGSALMKDPKLVKEILNHVISAVCIPVTLKIRTGWDIKHRNAIEIAKIAEDCGISSLAIHGRTRNQAYTGFSEFETIRQIKQTINIPVIANGDISCVEDAEFILKYTQADGLMLGRVTRGNPWIFKEIINSLNNEKHTTSVTLSAKKEVILKHLHAIHQHYEGKQAVCIARKHIGWYLSDLIRQDEDFLKSLRYEIFSISEANKQYQILKDILERIIISSHKNII
ncbi:MAG TPA: tRNA dihydrouridine synthase DusB [Leucothrix sp.]|nr:tRNA dihydrouridine synthase DusB [Leucothrix sp.]